MNTQKNNRAQKLYLCTVAFCVLMGSLCLQSAQAGLIGLWTFDEGSGTTAIDHSGYGNDGDIRNGAVYVSTPGVGNQGISMDGVDDWVNFGSNSIFDITGDVTLEAWVSIDTQISGANHIIFGKTANEYEMGYEVAGTKVNAQVFGVKAQEYGPVTLAPSNHQIVVEHSSGAFPLRLFVDGALVAGGGGFAALFSNAAQNLTAAGDQDVGGNHMKMVIDQLAIYDSYLSDSEILANFEAGPLLPEPSTSALALIGLAGLGWRRSRKNRA